MKYLFLLLFTGIAATLTAQSPVGFWQTIDDETGEHKSIVEVYERDGRLEGAIRELLLKPADTVCENCPDELKNKPVVGMVIMKDLKKSGDQWKSNYILDPESGKTYRCSIWLQEGNNNLLKVRGKHWTGLYRTQDWHRVN